MAFQVAAAYVANDGGTAVTSGTFNVASGDLIVVVLNCGELGQGAEGITHTLSDNQTPDLTYTQIAQRDDTDGLDGGVAAYYHVAAAAITGLTITDTVSGAASPESPAIKVYIYPAGEFDSVTQVGAQVEGDWTIDGQQTLDITPLTSGVGVLVCTDWNQTGTPTSADTTFTGFDTAFAISGGSGFVALTASVAKNADMDSGGTPSGNYLWFELRKAAGGASTFLKDIIGHGVVPWKR